MNTGQDEEIEEEKTVEVPVIEDKPIEEDVHDVQTSLKKVTKIIVKKNIQTGQEEEVEVEENPTTIKEDLAQPQTTKKITTTKVIKVKTIKKNINTGMDEEVEENAEVEEPIQETTTQVEEPKITETSSEHTTKKVITHRIIIKKVKKNIQTGQDEEYEEEVDQPVEEIETEHPLSTPKITEVSTIY